MPPNFARLNVTAAILTGICLVGLALMIAWAFVVIMGLIFSPDGWMSVIRVE